MISPNRNPRIGMRSSSYTHNGAVLARLPKLVTINSAMEVDLTGQVNAEQSGTQYLGGTGGQVDFVRAGSRSPGGHSIIALPATAKGGAISRIAVALSGPVTTARSDVDVIVTEFGAAELKGQTLAERARRLVENCPSGFSRGAGQGGRCHPAEGILMSDAVLFDARDDGIAIITLNRPETRNALSKEIRAGLFAAWERFERDPALRIAILTGSGDKAFCAGGDLKEMVEQRAHGAAARHVPGAGRQHRAEQADDRGGQRRRFCRRLDDCPSLRFMCREYASAIRHYGSQGGQELALGGAADPYDPAADHDGDRAHRKTDQRATRL